MLNSFLQFVLSWNHINQIMTWCASSALARLVVVRLVAVSPDLYQCCSKTCWMRFGVWICPNLVLSFFLLACLCSFNLSFLVFWFFCFGLVLGGFLFVQHRRRTFFLSLRWSLFCVLLLQFFFVWVFFALSLCSFVGGGRLSAWFLCSTSPPGGNQVDGLPPAFS